MYWVLVFAIVTFVVCYVSIPPDIRSQLAENCCDRRGRLKRKYVIREFFAVANFVSGVFFFSFITVLLALFAFLLVDAYVIPADLATSAMSLAELDFHQWKENLTAGDDSIKSQYEQWHVAEGGSIDSARRTIEILWLSLPFVFVGCIGVVALALRAMSKSYKAALEDLVERSSYRDLAHIRKRYLAENEKRGQSMPSSLWVADTSNDS